LPVQLLPFQLSQGCQHGVTQPIRNVTLNSRHAFRLGAPAKAQNFPAPKYL